MKTYEIEKKLQSKWLSTWSLFTNTWSDKNPYIILNNEKNMLTFNTKSTLHDYPSLVERESYGILILLLLLLLL